MTAGSDSAGVGSPWTVSGTAAATGASISSMASGATCFAGRLYFASDSPGSRMTSLDCGSSRRVSCSGAAASTAGDSMAGESTSDTYFESGNPPPPFRRRRERRLRSPRSFDDPSERGDPSLRSDGWFAAGGAAGAADSGSDAATGSSAASTGFSAGFANPCGGRSLRPSRRVNPPVRAGRSSAGPVILSYSSFSSKKSET